LAHSGAFPPPVELTTGRPVSLPPHNPTGQAARGECWTESKIETGESRSTKIALPRRAALSQSRGIWVGGRPTIVVSSPGSQPSGRFTDTQQQLLAVTDALAKWAAPGTPRNFPGVSRPGTPRPYKNPDGPAGQVYFVFREYIFALCPWRKEGNGPPPERHSPFLRKTKPPIDE